MAWSNCSQQDVGAEGGVYYPNMWRLHEERLNAWLWTALELRLSTPIKTEGWACRQLSISEI